MVCRTTEKGDLQKAAEIRALRSMNLRPGNRTLDIIKGIFQVCGGSENPNWFRPRRKRCLIGFSFFFKVRKTPPPPLGRSPS